MYFYQIINFEISITQVIICIFA